MPENEVSEEMLKADRKAIDVLVANLIPTSKYFEARFDNMQNQMDRFSDDLKDLRSDMYQRFEQVDKRFEQVDKRFEQVDKRFEQVDKRFEQMIFSIDRLSEKLEYRDEKQRAFTLKMFSISIGISVLGVMGAFFKMIGII